MNSIVAVAKEQGIPHDRIITEVFNQGSQRQTGKVASWPQNMYALGALGIGFGSLAIMISEIVKTLPYIPLTDEKALNVPLKTSGQREKDLDALVNGLKEDLSRPNSPSVDAALAASQSTGQSPIASLPQQKTTVYTPAPVPAPAPVQPKCTTSQSGVTTCI
jgi:hypothetical protein